LRRRGAAWGNLYHLQEERGSMGEYVVYHLEAVREGALRINSNYYKPFFDLLPKARNLSIGNEPPIYIMSAWVCLHCC
jgi:hypothetical protein